MLMKTTVAAAAIPRTCRPMLASSGCDNQVELGDRLLVQSPPGLLTPQRETCVPPGLLTPQRETCVPPERHSIC